MHALHFTLEVTPVTPTRARLELEAPTPLVEKVARVLLDPGDAQPEHQPTSRVKLKQRKATARTRRKKLPVVLLTCGFCSNRFEGDPRRKYCSRRCRMKALNLERHPFPNGQDQEVLA